MGLQHTGKKKNTHFMRTKFCLFILFLKAIYQIQTLDDFRRLLRVQTTTNLSGCLVEKIKIKKSEKTHIIHQSNCPYRHLPTYKHVQAVSSADKT